MGCPFLEYRRESAEKRFDEPRAYCTAAEQFVQAMRADICNDRYGLEHDRDCEIYLEHAGNDGDGGGPEDDGAGAPEEENARGKAEGGEGR